MKTTDIGFEKFPEDFKANPDTAFIRHTFCKWSENLGIIDDFYDLVGHKLFECDFNPIFTELEKRSCKKYIDWLIEARNKIYEGKDPYDVLSYYDMVLADLIMEDEKHGKSYGRSR